MISYNLQDLESIISSNNNGIHSVYYDIEGREFEGDPCRQYYVFDRELLLPEYFIEYSIESDLDVLTTKIEKLIVDIAYSNKLSQANMPASLDDLAKKISEEEVIYFKFLAVELT